MFETKCFDCAKFGKTCNDMIGQELTCPDFISEHTVRMMKHVLTKTQFRYWYDYYINDMKLSDISIAYDVHITTVCHVLKNARKRVLQNG